MTTLNDKLNLAISEEVYRNTKTFAICRRFYRFTKYGSFAFSAMEYDEKGVPLNQHNIIMDSEDIRNLYELVPESELPKLLRTASSLSQPKCTRQVNPNAVNVKDGESEHEKPKLLEMPTNQWNDNEAGFYYFIRDYSYPIPRNSPKDKRNLSKILVGME